MFDMKDLFEEAIHLLKQLIAIPSFSKEEAGTADLLESWLAKHGIISQRIGNNILAKSQYFDKAKPTVLLNAHHDTVKPVAGYTIDPFAPIVKDDKLYGLGSNDAGASLVSLMVTFLHFYNKEHLPFNLLLAATAEEEISGINGIRAVMPELDNINCAIVGEPTAMQMAVAERGLLVLDVFAKGTSGHAARNEGTSALYVAINDINWFREYEFERISALLGKVSMNVTVIETDNKAHNVVPDQCRFTVDIRINELYTHEEVLAIIRENIKSAIKPRSLHLRSSVISLDHPLVQSGSRCGMQYYGSPTLSDKALMPFPALKLGPGDSARSHTADEFIYLHQIEEGIDKYIKLIEGLVFV
jgi:acetylornithine deacetylase/succinyl-diaminopimelate desuccinylase-like protein